MAGALLPDALWNLIAPLLPVPPARPNSGRPRVADRACLAGILFALRSGIPWQMLPQELGCGSGMTWWRRLRDWQHQGIWDHNMRPVSEITADKGPAGARMIAKERQRSTPIVVGPTNALNEIHVRMADTKEEAW